MIAIAASATTTSVQVVEQGSRFVADRMAGMEPSVGKFRFIAVGHLLEILIKAAEFKCSRPRNREVATDEIGGYGLEGIELKGSEMLWMVFALVPGLQHTTSN